MYQLDNWSTMDLISSSAKLMVFLLLERDHHACEAPFDLKLHVFEDPGIFTYHSVALKKRTISQQIHAILRFVHNFKQNHQNRRS